MAKKKKGYDVIVRVVVETTVKVNANTLEEALTEARKLTVRDVVSFETDYNDGGIAVTGLFGSDEELK